MLRHRYETLMHIVSITDLFKSGDESTDNMMELAWVATHLDDDVRSVTTETTTSDFSGMTTKQANKVRV